MTAKKKVLHIITVSFVINHFFGNQFNYLKKYGNEYYLGCTPSEEFEELAEAYGYKRFGVEVTRNISPIKDICAILKIIFFIKRHKIDVVVGHTPKGGMVAMLAGFLTRVPERVYFRHGIIYETSTGLKRLLLMNIDRLSGTLATKVVCVSNDVRRISIADNLNLETKNIVLGLGTCNGIDVNNKYNPSNYTDLFRDDFRSKLNIGKSDIIIGYVGRLVKDKGINELIASWSILTARFNNIKLLLVGPIEERDSISEDSKIIIQQDQSIIYTGFVMDSGPYFSIMDIFILPTYREGFPTVSLEASSMELPVLITKATGCSEAVIEGETGFFVDNTVDSIVNGISIYLSDESIRLSHGINGRRFVLNNFEEKKIWEEIRSKLEY